MDWKRLTIMKCPKCNHNISDKNSSMAYECEDCDFFISYEKFQRLITEMMMPKKPKYDPDRVDRSGWEW